MADDNTMNLRNWVVPRTSGNDQDSNTENTDERRAVLLAKNEISDQSDKQEPSLALALGQMTRILQVLDQNSHQSTTRLDAVLAAITASNENIAQIGQLLTRNEQPMMGPLGPVGTLVLQNPVTPVNRQPQVAPFQTAYRLATLNAGQKLEVAWRLSPPPPLLAYQPQNVGIKAGGGSP